jgi:DNA polymerase elongation subunit (family B)
MVKIKSIKTRKYNGYVYDLSIKNTESPYFYANRVLTHNSLYPHIMMQANLYGKSNDGWKGTGISYTNGTYNTDELAPVGNVLQTLYKRRLEYKKEKNAKEYTIKIIINTIYGLLGNPAFASVSDFTAAADCTRLGRQWVNAARLHFAEHGYNVLYTDTDSVYLEDPFNNKKKLLDIKNKHIDDIKKSVPFPQDTFDMGVDDEISYMAFFKGADGKLLKKNYLYVTKGGKLKIKGMQIIKSTCTPLARTIFERFIKPEIINNNRGKKMRHKWQRSQIEQWIIDLLKEDITLASVFYKCKAPEEYKLASQIQAQIAAHPDYGEGQHRMIKLKCAHPKGAGTYKNYVGVQFANDIRLSQIDLTKTWQELKPFIEDAQKTLGAFW